MSDRDSEKPIHPLDDLKENSDIFETYDSKSAWFTHRSQNVTATGNAQQADDDLSVSALIPPEHPPIPALRPSRSNHMELPPRELPIENKKTKTADCGGNCRSSGAKTPPKKYSIQFLIKDAQGHPCEGMYYGVYIKDQCYFRPDLIIDNKGKAEGEQGKTIIFDCDTPSDVYLYIGHRTENWLTLPGVIQEHGKMNPPANKDDEAPLKIDVMDLTEKHKFTEFSTKRLWKPWTFLPDSKGEKYTLGQERPVLNPYQDNKISAKSNATVGIGHLIHYGPLILNDDKIDKVIRELHQKNIPVTKASIKENLNPVLGLQETAPKGKELELSKAQKEVEFIGSLSHEGFMKLYRQDLKTNASRIPLQIYVPLYQYEYDTLVDICFNGGIAALHNPKNSVKLDDILNTGAYSNIPATIDAYDAHGFTSRPIQQKALWRGIYTPGNNKIAPYIDHLYWTPRNDIK